MTAIVDIIGREVLDSRGNPTVEVDVVLEDGAHGRAAVPSGASTGAHEAIELRDGDKKRYLGKGVLKAVEAVNGEIFDALSGMDAEDQRRIDDALIELDGTPNKGAARRQCHPGRVAGGGEGRGGGGGAAALPLSGRRQRASAAGADDEHHQRRGARRQPHRHPGVHDHAGRGGELRGSRSAWARRSSTPCARACKDAGHGTNVGDEGGFAPNLKSAEEALSFVMRSIEEAGYKPGEDVALALDCAATEFFKDGKYRMEGEGKALDSAGMAKYLEGLVSRFPIVSIEDGMAEDDWEGWKALTQAIGKKCQLVGDDLFVTNTKRLAQGIEGGIANSILVKVNQIGSLTETLRGRRHGAARRLHGGDLAPLGRDGGCNDRRHRGRHQRRADQDGLAVALRPHGQVQPADPHRGGAGRRGGVCGEAGIEALAIDRRRPSP